MKTSEFFRGGLGKVWPRSPSSYAPLTESRRRQCELDWYSPESGKESVKRKRKGRKRRADTLVTVALQLRRPAGSDRTSEPVTLVARLA